MAEPTPVVSRVAPEQWETYRTVRLEMLREAPRAFGQSLEDALARTPAMWRDRLTSPTWYAHDGTAGEPPTEPALVLGAVSTYRFPEQADDETCLVGMWVRPTVRGRRVGELLVGAALAAARADGLARVTLDVAEENVSARRLYERLGFTPTGRTGVLPNDPTVAEFEMALPLT